MVPSGVGRTTCFPRRVITADGRRPVLFLAHNDDIRSASGTFSRLMGPSLGASELLELQHRAGLDARGFRRHSQSSLVRTSHVREAKRKLFFEHFRTAKFTAGEMSSASSRCCAIELYSASLSWRSPGRNVAAQTSFMRRDKGLLTSIPRSQPRGKAVAVIQRS